MEWEVVDLTSYLEGCGDDQINAMCATVSRTLRETGALVVKDPRCSVDDSDRFLDMMERYFQMSEEFKIQQERRQLHYQVESID